jgi:diguanylate cyclase (GGDEF)-like protein
LGLSDDRPAGDDQIRREQIRLAPFGALDLVDPDPDDRFDRLTRLAQRVLGVPLAVVSLVRDGRRWFPLHAGGQAVETSPLAPFWARTLLEDDVFVVPDATSDPRFADNAIVAGPPGIRFFAGCPLSAPDGTRLGALCLVDQQARELSPVELDLVRDLAAMVERELAVLRLATIDELTGVTNRRGLLAVGRHVLAMAERFKRPATLLYVDVDRLKDINDTLGHEAGDRALCEIAELLTDSLRAADVVARVGGDEFCALLSDTSPETLSPLLARLRARVTDLNLQPNRDYTIEFSEGWVAYDPAEPCSIETLMARGDAQMYEQKQAKRNGTARASGG